MTTNKRNTPVRGLEGVVAADTALTYVDGENGKLYHRGYELDQLAGKICYEEMVHLLWYGELPDQSQLDDFRAELVAEMRLPEQVFDLLRLAPPNANPMVVLRTAVSALGMFDPDGGKNTEAANQRKARRILAQVATIVASLHRIHEKPALSADARMGFAENYLYMFNGKPPTELERKVLDTTLVLHADHGLAASTFAARATVSTLAGMHSALTSALASLKGPLHGGANREVMEMLEQISAPDRVQSYIEGMLSNGKRIMGFGHRVYKTEDPRSRHLRRFSEKLSHGAGTADLYEMSHRIEELVLEHKGIRPNVDFYSATVQRALGIPKEFYTCIFASARTAGWMAHIMEQFRDNRLIRPRSNYTGGFDRTYTPVETR
ncbi:MAG: citrate/2-methylcitrate synthase [Myxococcota bacterium]|nr:citrate/2-methylcitrate synthase [Myxococcota bacterium]